VAAAQLPAGAVAAPFFGRAAEPPAAFADSRDMS